MAGNKWPYKKYKKRVGEKRGPYNKRERNAATALSQDAASNLQGPSQDTVVRKQAAAPTEKAAPITHTSASVDDKRSKNIPSQV